MEPIIRFPANTSLDLHGNKLELLLVPLLSASIRLRVGLGGADRLLLPDGVSSCSGSRVLLYLMTFGGGGFESLEMAVSLGW